MKGRGRKTLTPQRLNLSKLEQGHVLLTCPPKSTFVQRRIQRLQKQVLRPYLGRQGYRFGARLSLGSWTYDETAKNQLDRLVEESCWPTHVLGISDPGKGEGVEARFPVPGFVDVQKTYLNKGYRMMAVEYVHMAPYGTLGNLPPHPARPDDKISAVQPKGADLVLHWARQTTYGNFYDTAQLIGIAMGMFGKNWLAFRKKGVICTELLVKGYTECGFNPFVGWDADSVFPAMFHPLMGFGFREVKGVIEDAVEEPEETPENTA